MSDDSNVIVQLTGQTPIAWDRLTWLEIQSMIGQGTDLVLLPLGATEQHGPHLPVNVDSVFAQSFCAYASARTGVPYLPTITYGCSLGHTDRWPGTISIWSNTLVETIRQIVHFLRAAGVRKLLLVNSHWGNISAARCAIDQIRFEFASTFSIGLKNTFDITPAVWAQFTDDAADFHANRAETALMMFLDPASVRMNLLQQADDPDRTSEKVFTYTVPQTSTNGVTGFPSRATAEDGKKLFLEIGEALIQIVQKAKTELPPIQS